MIPHLKTGSAQSAPWVDTGVIYVSRKKCADRSMEVEVSFFLEILTDQLTTTNMGVTWEVTLKFFPQGVNLFCTLRPWSDFKLFTLLG